MALILECFYSLSLWSWNNSSICLSIIWGNSFWNSSRDPIYLLLFLMWTPHVTYCLTWLALPNLFEDAIAIIIEPWSLHMMAERNYLMVSCCHPSTPPNQSTKICNSPSICSHSIEKHYFIHIGHGNFRTYDRFDLQNFGFDAGEGEVIFHISFQL